jgi:hypothetical protein
LYDAVRLLQQNILSPRELVDPEHGVKEEAFLF